MSTYCCVCLKNEEDPENKLVSCNGQGCRVLVHQDCYGIPSIPSSGIWYCRKCESQERAARVRCELCPMKDGAYKRTDQGGWAHVVCALYIPEVTFGDISSMEPIVTSRVPRDRLSKVCSLCEDRGMESNATFGACMSCKYKTCKVYFHVTCAQKNGLLCEEEDPKDPTCLQYSGYCVNHMKKKKGRRDSALKRENRRSQQRSISTDTTSPLTVDGGLPVAVSSEVKMSPHHSSIKKRARKRKLSSSSESSDVSEVSPSFSTSLVPTESPALVLPETSTHQYLPNVEETDVKETTSDSVLASDTFLDRNTEALLANSSQGEQPQHDWSLKEERSSDSSDSSSDDTSGSSSEASEEEETDGHKQQQQQQQQQEQQQQQQQQTEDDTEDMDVNVAHSDPVTSPQEAMFSPSGSSVESSTQQEESDAVTHGNKEDKLTVKGISHGKMTGKGQKGTEQTGSKTPKGLSPRGGVRRGGRGRISPSSRGRGGGVNRSRGGRTVKSKSTVSGSVQQVARTRKRNKDLNPPDTLEELLKQQWEETVSFLSNSNPKQAAAASLLAELVRLQDENRKMEQRIVELTSQREFYQGTNGQLCKILHDNGSTVVNGGESTRSNSQLNGRMDEDITLEVPAGTSHSTGLNAEHQPQPWGQPSSNHSINSGIGSETQANLAVMSLSTSTPVNTLWMNTNATRRTNEQGSEDIGRSFDSSLWTMSGWRQESYCPQGSSRRQMQQREDASKRAD